MVRPEMIAFEMSLGVLDPDADRRNVVDRCGAHFDPP
jgi:hypothetical protein